MKMIILFCILLLTNIFIYSEKVDEKTTTNSLGQAVLTETYKDDPDGMYKIERYYKNKDTDENNLIQSILYFKDNHQFKEKQIDSYKNAIQISSISYFKINNPYHWIKSIETYTKEGKTINLYYDEDEPDEINYSISNYNSNNQRIKIEYILKKNNKKYEEKEVKYLKNDKIIKEEVYYLKNSENIENTITYYIDYDKHIIEKQENKYLKSPNYLINSELFCYSDGNMKNQIFYFNIKNPKGYVKMEVKWSESGVLYDKKYYDKAGNEINPN